LISQREIIFAFIVPVILTAAFLIASAKSKLAWLTIVGLAIAVAIAFLGAHSIPKFPPNSVEGWLVYLLAAAIVVGMIDWIARPPAIVRTLLALVLFVLTTWLLLRPLQHSMTPMIRWTWIIALAALVTIWWMLLDTFAGDSPSGLILALAGLAAAGAAILLLDTSQDSYGKLAGAVALIFWTSALIAAFIPIRVPTTIIAVALWSLLILGCFYGDVKKTDAGLLMLAPLITWRGQHARSRRLPHLVFSVIPALVVISYVTIPAAIELRRTILQTTQGGELD